MRRFARFLVWAFGVVFSLSSCDSSREEASPVSYSSKEILEYDVHSMVVGLSGEVSEESLLAAVEPFSWWYDDVIRVRWLFDFGSRALAVSILYDDFRLQSLSSLEGSLVFSDSTWVFTDFSPGSSPSPRGRTLEINGSLDVDRRLFPLVPITGVLYVTGPSTKITFDLLVEFTAEGFIPSGSIDLDTAYPREPRWGDEHTLDVAALLLLVGLF